MLVRSKIVEPYFQADFLEPVEKVVPGVRKERAIYPVKPWLINHLPSPSEAAFSLQVRQLLVTNRRLPDDVDRGHLEVRFSL